jgi:hypothetical protein
MIWNVPGVERGRPRQEGGLGRTLAGGLLLLLLLNMMVILLRL